MSYRKILVSVNAGDGARNAVETAFALARMFGAHVEGLHVRIEPAEAVPYVGEGMSGALVQELVELTERENEQRAAAARELFETSRLTADLPRADTPGAVGASAAWVEEAGRQADALILAGQLADLIVVGRTGGEAAGSTPVLTNVLFGTGRPVLVAPDEGNSAIPTVGTGTLRRVIVAWKQSAEAARAVSGALPLLARTEQVIIVGAGEGREAEAGLERLANYLAWHGISAERTLLQSTDFAGDALAAAGEGADLIVMGGYSHSRLRELILGGVTRHMLEKTTLPLLLAH